MIEAGQRHRLLAILAADAVGYSRLMSLDEQATLAALDAARAVFRQQSELHQGRVVDTAGDSVLAVFDTAAGAAEAALAIQQRLSEAQDGVAPPGRRMDFRIGVHLGDVIEKADGTVYGNGVNVAARLQTLAEPGATWVSHALRGALGSRPQWTLDDRGRHAVKNIAEPVHAYLLSVGTAKRTAAQRHGIRWRLRGVAGLVAAGLASALWLLLSGPRSLWSPLEPATGPRPMSLMVGAITAAPGDAEGAAVANRLHRELRAALSAPGFSTSLTVMAPPAAAATSDAIVQAKGAGARFVVEGSTTHREGLSYATTLQLVDAATGALQGAAVVDFKPDADAAARSRRLDAAAEKILGLVTASESKRVLALPVSALAPVELVVRAGAVYDAKPTLEGINEALVLIDRALALDPRYVQALNGKAFVLLNRYDEEARPDHDRYARELDALTAQAIALDAQNPVAWAYRRIALIFNGQWSAAMAADDKALDITRGAPWAWRGKATTATVMGQPDKALQWLQADPVRLSDSTDVLISVCEAQLLLGQPQAAATACEQAAGGDPSIWSVHQYLAAALANLGQVERARASLQIVEEKSPGLTIDRIRNSRWTAHPEYKRLAESTYYAGLRRAGMPER